MARLDGRNYIRRRERYFLGLSGSFLMRLFFFPTHDILVLLQIDEDPSLVPEAIQGGTFGFNSSANVPAEGFQF